MENYPRKKVFAYHNKTTNGRQLVFSPPVPMVGTTGIEPVTSCV